jgi:putative ABC transport system permease protein
MSILTDVRYALRRFQAAPGFVAVAAITLALGIGATTAIYSVIDSLMLKPLPYGDPARLINVGTQSRTSVGMYFDGDQIADLKSRTELFAAVDAYNFDGMKTLGANEPTQATSAVVGGALMRILAVPPQLGRIIDESDVHEGRQVMVLGDELWRSAFGADPSIVGRAITLNDTTVEVVGVMPPSFKFPNVRVDLWRPFDPLKGPAGRPMFAMARLPSDRPVRDAIARLEGSTIAARNRQGAVVQTPLRVAPSLGRYLNTPVRTAIFLLSGAVVLVLLIACANIANLLMVQNAGRYREVAVRTALGASRGVLVRQLLIESALLAAIGGGLGLIASQWFLDALVISAPENSGIVNVNGFALDRRVILFAISATMVTGCLFGILPAFKGARGSADALRSGGRSATDGPRQERLRQAFVVVQLAVSMVLLVGATLLGRTFVHLNRVDPGFDPENLALATMELPAWRYRDAAARSAFADAVLERVRTLPGVQAATLTGGGGTHFGLVFEIEGRGAVLDDPRLEVPSDIVGPEYFSMMRIPIVAGRTFNAEDVLNGPPAIILSQALATRLWGAENPVGQRFRMRQRPKEPWYTVVGVAGNVYQDNYSQTRNQPAFYMPLSQSQPPAFLTVTARTFGNPAALLPLIREQVRVIDSGQPIWQLRTGQMEFAEFVALPRFYTMVMGVLAGLGVIIAAIGLYGVLAYAISQRTRELGVRIALGAQKTDVLGLVLRNGASATALGLAAGFAGSLFLTRWIESMLIDVPRLDPVSYAVAAVLFAVIALAACWIPARRATKVDPIVALRYE